MSEGRMSEGGITVHPADIDIKLGANVLTLRLTMGGLAQMSAKLGVSGPAELAALFRKLDQAKARVIIDSVTHIGGPKPADDKIALVMPYVSELFEKALRPLTAQPSADAGQSDKLKSRPALQDASTWPFASWLRLAVRHLGLSPDEFWTMRVHDWWWLIEKPAAPNLGRKSLAALQKQFPDK